MEPNKKHPDNDQTYYVLGGGSTGIALARNLQADGRTVHFVGDLEPPDDIPAMRDDPADMSVVQHIDLPPNAVVIAATRSDKRNLLIAQLVRTTTDVRQIVVLTNQPERREPIADAGYEPLCVTTAVSDALTKTV